jgi:amidase
MVDTYATARAMLADLEAKRISARELLTAHLAQNDKIAASIHAVVETDLARAHRDAAAIDAARASGEPLGPLAGLPMTIKDGFDVENMPATSGNPKFLARAKSCADATLVARARRAGAVIWGKTNVPFMLGDVQSYNAIYGTTNNPYDVTKVPGGSSGGAAAALAAGVTPLEIGSDIGGSLRSPASFCGVTALKPTWGVLDLRGHVPPGPDSHVEGDLGVGGPMARTVDDLKLLWSVLRQGPPLARRDVKAARVAIWDEEAGWPLSSDVRAGVRRAGDALSQAGAQVEHAKPAIDGRRLMEFYQTILTAQIGAGLPEHLLETYEAQRSADRRLVAEGGRAAIGAAYRLRAAASYREVVRAKVEQQAHKEILAEFFGRYDAIVMPIVLVTAFPHQQQPGFQDRLLDVDGEQVPYPHVLDWISLATATHTPSLAVQAGQTTAGMPVGVQIVGPWHGEDRLFDLAAAVEDALGGFRPPAL